jgi:ribonuclease HII
MKFVPKTVIGVDEAGRGPLAGPVAVGVVAVAHGFDVAKEFPGVADSKTLSEKKREKLFSLLEDHAQKGDVRFLVELGGADRIDAEGIAVVLQKAVACGVYGLAPEIKDVHVFLDGALKAPKEYSQETIIRGDFLVPLISLASIAAKVVRDRLMKKLAEVHPLYGFEIHKGYGTRAHYEALKKHGACVIHRTTFLHIDRTPHEE